MLFKNTPACEDGLKHVYLTPKKLIIKDGVEGTAAISGGGAMEPFLTARKLCTIPQGCVLLVDFGEEISGGMRLVFHKNDGKRVRMTFGESCAEALSSIGEDGSTNDHATRDTVIEVQSYSVTEYGRQGFRFVRIEAVDAPLRLTGLFARADFRDLAWLGSFESSDKRLSEIWRVGARTVHLCMQDMLYDGIKRDRLVSVGGMHPAVRAALSLFGQTECIRKSLDFAKNTTPRGEWMNGFPSYSLWWVLIQYDVYMHGGDKAYLEESIGCMLDILARFSVHIQNDGGIMGLNNFLDLSMYDNNSAKDAAFGALAVMAFERGAFLCREIGTDDLNATADVLMQYVSRLSRHVSWSINKQAVAMQVLSGQKDAAGARETLMKDTPHSISVFFGYYVLLALSLGGNTKHALDTVKKYWGAMIDLGATSFFESFELSEVEGDVPPLKINAIPADGFKNVYAEGGQRCCKGYRRSLCHGWASGPLSWITEHILGVEILEPGCRRVRIKPCLAGLSWFKGSFPTPYGNIEISVTKTDGEPLIEIKAPSGVEIVR